MYILHPPWLTKHEIIEAGTEFSIETNLARPGFRFRFPTYEAVWSIAPDRIAAESTSRKTDCAQMVAKVLRALPETPLFAIGNNVVYAATLDELSALSHTIRDFGQPESPHDGETVVQRSFHVAVKRGEGKVANLQLSIKEEAIELGGNLHTKLDGVEDASKEAIAAAERFFQDRDSAKGLAEHFFKVKIGHDANDD